MQEPNNNLQPHHDDIKKDHVNDPLSEDFKRHHGKYLNPRPHADPHKKRIDDPMLHGPGLGKEREVLSKGTAGVDEATFGEAEG